VIDVKILIFQLVFTLACIQTKDVSFRHNDMSLTNVLVQALEIPEGYETHMYHYQFGEYHFLIPIQTFSLRMWDFDFANSDHLPNNKVFTISKDTQKPVNFFEEYGIVNTPCLQYDLHYFFKYLQDSTSFYRRNEGKTEARDLVDYINSWTKFSGWSEGYSTGLFSKKKPAVENFRLSTFTQRLLGSEDQSLSNRTKLSRILKKDIYTTCFQSDGPVKLPYREFTAAHSLKMCKLFDPFRATPESVENYRDKILAHYFIDI
jgi:hypothetical protein